MATFYRLSEYRKKHRSIFFTRLELNQLLGLYSVQVARGQWRDYAIDQRDGTASFAIFRHTHESALFTVVKSIPGSNKAGDYTVLSGRELIVSARTLPDLLAGLLKKLPSSRLASDERYR